MMGKCLFMRKGKTHTAPAKGLPFGYTKLAYIQSSGTQYIDTGFTPNQDTRVDLKISTSNSGSKTMLGSDVSWTGNGFAIGVGFSHYGTETSNNSGMNDGSVHEISLNKNVLYIDGTAAKTYSVQTFSVGYPMALFANNRSGIIDEKTAMNLYYCQIYDNETLVRDFVPCINASDEVGLYDLVGKQFYGNAGTGTFTGSEVA